LDAPTILIVDDDPDMRLYLRGCLAGLRSGVGRLLEAADGMEALRIVRAESVQLVICELVLPSFGGAGLCRAIRSDPVLHARVPVLLISDGDAGDGTNGPSDGFLAKPFNARQLLVAVERLLSAGAS
jgi:CheY-like chemotaxis protein